MSETKWTPGPWQAHSLMVSEADKPIGRGHDICHCGLGMRPNREVGQSDANAQLIAAAPELFEALVAIVRSVDLNQAVVNGFLQIDARAALAKARGEQP
jgi:hypothetical protein